MTSLQGSRTHVKSQLTGKVALEEVPGVAHLSLVDGVVHLDEAAAVFEGMVVGWSRQQSSRLLADTTIEPRLALLRRFAEFAESYPWS